MLDELDDGKKEEVKDPEEKDEDDEDKEELSSVVDDFVNGDLGKVRDAIKKQSVKAVSQSVYGEPDSEDDDDDKSDDDDKNDDKDGDV